MQIYTIAAFILYFAMLLSIGLICHRKQTTTSGFIVGNRSLNFWLVALSAHASDMSAWLFMAFPMKIFTLGLSHVWVALGLLVGMFLNWQFVAPKLRTQTENLHSYTLSTFFEKRFNDTSGAIRFISAVAMLIFLTHYLSAGLIAMGNLFELVFGLNYIVGLLISMSVVVAYTFVGGFTTVAWTDLFQALFLLVMILLVPAFAFFEIGGWDPIFRAAQQNQIPLSFLPEASVDSYITIFSLSLGWGLGYFGMPHIITKFMGIKHVSDMRKSQWVGMSWQVVALGAAAFVGIVAIGYFPQGLEKPEMVFVEMVKSLSHPFIAGLILCGIIAANMSTMDSQVLVCSSIISEDLYKHFWTKVPSDRKVLWTSKIAVILISVVSLLLAFNKSATIADTVLYSWSGLGSAFGPLVLASLYCSKANKYGALAGIIIGTLVVMVWPTLNPYVTKYEILPMIPGFGLSFLAIYLVSKFTTSNEKTSEAM